MKKRASVSIVGSIAGFVLGGVLSTAPAFADDYLLGEMESLYSSLEKDDLARNELNLRLADLYFDVSIQEGEDDSLAKKRYRSLELYRSSLEGTNGLKKVNDLKLVKVHFQIARLLTKLGNKKEATKHFEFVFKNSLSPKDMKRESATSLAEWYEEDANFKKSFSYYTSAISLCESVNACNYTYYKRAWLLYKETRLEDAISDLGKSLWGKNGGVRQQSLDDYILFLSNRMTDGKSEFKELAKLVQKSGQEDLLQRLSIAYYSAGNRVAGSYILSEIHKKTPELFYEARLLEESYGFRHWENVNLYLSQLESRSIRDLPAKKETDKEINSILKRFIVQVDAERVKNQDLNIVLKKSIDVFMSLYPEDSMYQKMQQGWLQVEANNNAKIERLKIWILAEVNRTKNFDYIRKLRQTRLSLAKKENNLGIVIEEAREISLILGDTIESREFDYIVAHSLYTLKNYKMAQPLFQKLSVLTKGASPDKWAVLSQNLALDIFNINKDYDSLISQVDTWSTLKTNDKAISQEFTTMQAIKEQALFERTVAMGDTAEALENFYQFCYSKVFEAKSCQNAKILSLKLKDQQKLISLLEREGDEKTLVVEYERMGEFEKAAKIYRKTLTRNSEIPDFLKISLLYEIAGNSVEKENILKQMIVKIKREKKIEKKFESLIFLTLDESGLIGSNSLSIPWSLKRKLALADRLEAEKSGKSTRRMILAQKEYTGPSWAKLVLKKVQKLDSSQRKVSFYGRNSQRLFKRRVYRIEKLSKVSGEYLEGGDLKTRIYILDLLKKAYQDFSVAIMSTPLPQGLDEATTIQVQTQLATMSAPYTDASVRYQNLQNEQLASMTDFEKTEISKELTAENINYSDLIKFEEKPEFIKKQGQKAEIDELIAVLKKNPEDILILRKIQANFESNKMARLASYFSGRANDLGPKMETK